MNAVLEEIQKTGRVLGKSGAIHTLHSAIDEEEGRFLEDLIRADTDIRLTLEIGCAYGVSSLRICNALRERNGAEHTILDPFQNAQWDGVGIQNLDRAGIDFYDLIEERSEFALPDLVKTREGSYDLVFVDGWHTLDHTLLDCFYATRLLRTGGYLVVDDLVLPAVRRALEYVVQYPCYRVHKALGEETRPTLKRRVLQFLLGTLRLPAFNADSLLHPDLRHRILGNRALRMLALRKTAPDGRDWNWYEPRF